MATEVQVDLEALLLPPDLWLLILTPLPPQSILAVSSCSQAFRRLCLGTHLWISASSTRWSLGPDEAVSTGNLFFGLFRKEREPGKPLPLEIVSCSCEEYDETYCLQNLVRSTGKAFCTKNPANKDVDIVLKLAPIEGQNMDNLVFFITDIDIRDPARGYSAPVDRSLVFVTHDPPELLNYQKFNHTLTNEYYTSIQAETTTKAIQQGLPVSFLSCSLRRKEQPQDVPLQWRSKLPTPAPVGKYILFKMLDSFGTGSNENIDVGYFGIQGFLFDTKEQKIIEPPPMPEFTDEPPDCSIM